jgi:DNA (cytosine-5)-methyltransferase 1
MIHPQFNLDLNHELIIDNFAGGGGASTGIELALGRHVDIAINHDAAAIAMHKANHPQTEHYCESVWDVNPREVTQGRPVGLVWLSPDCKHFSKAKGGKPVEKKIRGLAWITLRWAATVKPRVIMLENVEEFKTWGPLDKQGKPIKIHQGRTFRSFKNALERQGYQVEHRELRACDYGVPTIRKRLFLVARRDGLPIIWPDQTHADPKSALVKSGKLKPWKTAADCIDWSIPCPSIFERKKELAVTTQRRIFKGIMRYVVNSDNPFIVTMGHGEGAGKTKRWGNGIQDIHKPLPTVTASGGHGLAAPVVIRQDMHKSNSQCNYSIDEPVRTLTGSGGMAVAAPFLAPLTHQASDRTADLQEPIPTVTGAHRGELAIVAPFIAEHANGSSQRNMPADEPLRTQCAEIKGGHFAIAAPVLSTYYGANKSGGERVGDVNDPLRTQSTENRFGLVTAFLAQFNTTGNGKPNVGHAVTEPVSTVTANGTQQSLVSAHITKFRNGSVGSDIDDPLHTVTAGGEQARPGTGNAMGLVSSNLVKLRGTNTGQPTDEPLHTVSAGGTHHAEVRAFLIKYYGTDQDPKLREPLHTLTTKERFGLVTVKGETYQIVDIGLRMLQPRELFRAQGFPESYYIGDDETQGLTLTKSDQVRMVGNSVCPPLAAELVRANLVDMQVKRMAA